MSKAARDHVQLFVDPICPFAWLTSRWLAEVEGVRNLDVTYRIMSLSVLNDGRADISDFYRDLVAAGWGPARVAVAVANRHGPIRLRRFYERFGERHHVGGQEPGPALLAAALDDARLPAALADAAGDERLDGQLRESHRAAVEPVGDDVGTPVLHIHPAHGRRHAVFGPVVTPAPRGEHAGRLWDGVLLLAASDNFFELKRSRTSPLCFA